jgi:hypothetical protein
MPNGQARQVGRVRGVIDKVLFATGQRRQVGRVRGVIGLKALSAGPREDGWP